MRQRYARGIADGNIPPSTDGGSYNRSRSANRDSRSRAVHGSGNDSRPIANGGGKCAARGSTGR